MIYVSGIEEKAVHVRGLEVMIDAAYHSSLPV
jgi:hypothetical protein